MKNFIQISTTLILFIDLKLYLQYIKTHKKGRYDGENARTLGILQLQFQES